MDCVNLNLNNEAKADSYLKSHLDNSENRFMIMWENRKDKHDKKIRWQDLIMKLMPIDSFPY